MKKWKKIMFGLLGGIFGLCVLFVSAWLLPFPIEGNWEYRPLMPGTDDSHLFFRFEKGKIMLMSSDTGYQPFWLGTYQRKGWGKYEADDEYFPGVLRSTFLLLTRANDPHDGTSWGRFFLRDFRIFTCRKIVNHPSTEWMSPVPKRSLRVTGIPGKRIFNTMGVELPMEDIEAQWDCLFKQQSLQIYTASNEVPFSVLETLEEQGVNYTIHTDQEWVASDTLKTNPIWRAIGRKMMFGLIIMPLSEDNRYGDDNRIYFTNTGDWGLKNFRQMIDRHRRDGEYWRKDLRLYVKDGVLPEDVRQMFDQFDLEYTVLDERVLYRGKSKDPYAKKGDTP